VHDREFSVFIAKLIIRGAIFAHNRAEARPRLSFTRKLLQFMTSLPALGAHLRTTLCRSGGHANLSGAELQVGSASERDQVPLMARCT